MAIPVDIEAQTVINQAVAVLILTVTDLRVARKVVGIAGLAGGR